MAEITGMQPLQPVYFAVPMEKGEDKQNYTTSIIRNQDANNQNQAAMYNKINELEARIAALGG